MVLCGFGLGEGGASSYLTGMYVTYQGTQICEHGSLEDLVPFESLT